MRKLTILIISLLVLAGGAYALIPTLFPDTPGLPRVPTGAGTIGSIIARLLGTTDLGNYGGDGTVTNSLALSGVTGSGYLKNTTCSGTDKWIGIDADGKALCGASTTILADYGTISEEGCPANVYHANGTQGSTNTGDTLKSGDIIKTGACGLTIAFSDLSILRLDADTTVSLDVATTAAPASQTIASAILSNGSLWGRILTETGSYSIGTDKIVAGVRGTSISVTSTGDTVGTFVYQTGTGWVFPITRSATNQTELNVLDSTVASTGTVTGGGLAGGYAATVFCVDSHGNRYPSPSMLPGKLIRIPHTGCTTTPSLSEEETKNSYIASPWIRRNTQKDIRYMYDTLAYSGNSLGTKREKINLELTNTQPPNIGDDEAKNICEEGYRWWTPRYGCQSEELYAIADYTKPSLYRGYPIPPTTDFIYSSGGTEIVPAISTHIEQASSLEGVHITGNQYLQYTPIAPIDLTYLSGKTIEIEFDNLPNGINMSGAINYGSTILDFGDVLRIGTKVNPSTGGIRSWICTYGTITTPLSTPYCDNTNTSPFLVTPSVSGSILKIQIRNIPPTLERFVIGNNITQGNSYLKQPINTTIRSIRIK